MNTEYSQAEKEQAFNESVKHNPDRIRRFDNMYPQELKQALFLDKYEDWQKVLFMLILDNIASEMSQQIRKELSEELGQNLQLIFANKLKPQ